MFSRSSIPNDVLKTLICSNCSNYLSIFPIHMAENSGVLCGRCNVPEEEKSTRYEAYESISQFLEFPCMYFSSGCDYSLTPTKMKEHEPFCEYMQLIDCTVNNTSLKCQWKGAKTAMVQHFKQNHSNLVLEVPSFKLNFLKIEKEHLLLEQQNEWFIINNEIDSRKGIFSCSIEHIKVNENSETPKYFLYFHSNGYYYKWPGKTTCNDKLLNSTHLASEMFHKDWSTIIINIQINLAGTGDDQKKPDIREEKNTYCDLLFHLKCPKCSSYMVPPIFQCYNGHSICSICKNKLNKTCPVCKMFIEETRNFVLEKITEHVKYPCTFYEFGCKYSCKPTYIKEHEECCEFHPFICPLNVPSLDCKRKDNLLQLLEHIENNHSNWVHKNPNQFKVSIDKPDYFMYLIKFRKKMFRCFYKRNLHLKKACWYVEFIGPENESKNYKFTVDIIDSSDPVTYSSTTGLVQPYAQSQITFEEPPTHGNYLVLYNEQLETFPTTLSCRTRVFKNEKL